MDVRYGPARITFSGDRQRAGGYLGKALHLLRRTEERARVGGLRVLGSQQALDDDSYCYAIIAGGIHAVHIVAGYAEEVAADEDVEPAAIPDFLSGVVRNGYIRNVPATEERAEHKVLDDFHPTNDCADAFELPRAFQDVERLAVEPHAAFDEALKNPAQNGIVFSQYTRLKPTMYSGTMRKVVQALMGFARQRREGRREISLYDGYPGKGKADAKHPYTKDVVKHGVQIRYDWRFSRTHGVTRASDGRWWLVEISITQGVIAMPLPLHEPTTKPAFRDWIENRTLRSIRAHERKNDDAVLTLLDELGGFPTGEAFPPGAELDAWIRAGRVVRLAEKGDLDAFYACSPYSSVMGWAFNARGTEAHNTANYLGDDGFLRGVHWAAVIRIGAAADVDLPKQYAVLVERLAALRGRDDYKDGIEAALWKCRRLTDEQVRSALQAPSAGAAYAIVDAIEAPPLASGSATVRRMSEGYLYNPAPLSGVIRFPEPEIGLLLSVEMKPAFGHARIDPRCDTLVHVFFAGEELKWVKYFRDPRNIPGRHTDDFEPCMYIGTWTALDEGGDVGQVVTFYTNDFDDRAELPDARTETITRGRDLGYSSVIVVDDLSRPYLGVVLRRRRFELVSESVTVSEPRVSASIAVPFHDREAYYYAVHHAHSGRSGVKQTHYEYVTDPWQCDTWRNFPGYTGDWIGDTINDGHWGRLDQHPSGCGPVTARTVLAPGAYYTEGTCSDVADNGAWCHTCDDADAMVYAIPEPPLPPVEYVNEPATEGTDVTLVSSSGLCPFRTFRSDEWWGLWDLHTPETDPRYSADQYIAETHGALGGAEIMQYGENLNAETYLRGAPQWAGMNEGGCTFIGVIDG